MFKRLYIKWLVWRGKAVDIWSKYAYPANVLSNLCDNRFSFDGIVCGSMEGLLQSLKQKDESIQVKICSMKGKDAKKESTTDWQQDQIIWWKGHAIERQSNEFLQLIRKAYAALYEQNEQFRKALTSTRGKTLYHSCGESDPRKTILTEKELCQILTELRNKSTIAL